MNLIKLTRGSNGTYAPQAASLVDVVNPAVLAGNTETMMCRLAIWVAAAIIIAK